MQSEPIEILTLPNEDSIKRKMEPANSTCDIRAVLKQVLNQVEESQSRDSHLIGITTGFAALDDKTMGMQKGNLIVVAARPSMGKTTLVLNLAENVLFSSSKTVIVFSMGTPAALIGSRIISSFGSVNRERMALQKSSLVNRRMDQMVQYVWHFRTNLLGLLTCLQNFTDTNMKSDVYSVK